MSAQDALTATAFLAVQRLTSIKKAEFLLNTALALIEDRSYHEVETYLDVCLKTPGLPKEDVKKALLARSNVRKLAGGPLQLDPSNVRVRSGLPYKEIHFSNVPASQRIPPEIWDRIAAQTPRYHLRKWLFVSPFHREIASHHIFHTVHIKFGEVQGADLGLDILDRAISDPVFASRVKSLRLYLDYEEGDVLNVLHCILNISLRAFKALQDFELVGNLEMPEEMVRVLSQKRLHGLGLKGWFSDTCSVTGFHGLRKFAFHVNENDAEPELEEICALLDTNKGTLRHLILGGCSYLDEQLESVFESVTIINLTHLDLFATDVSGFVMNRIVGALNLQSLTFHGSLQETAAGIEVFTGATGCFLLPHLESFRFVMEDQVDEELHDCVANFLRKREKLQRLDLGGCPCDMVQDILPGLSSLRVLAIHIDEVSQEIESLVEALPTQMVAIKFLVGDSDIPLDEYSSYFTRFNTLSFLHLELLDTEKPAEMSENDFQMQTDKSLHSIATAIPSLDFLAWQDKLYVVVRSGDVSSTVDLRELPTYSDLGYGSGVDVLSEDIAWLQQKTRWWDSK